jgi:hypothetical protein
VHPLRRLDAHVLKLVLGQQDSDALSSVVKISQPADQH